MTRVRAAAASLLAFITLSSAIMAGEVTLPEKLAARGGPHQVVKRDAAGAPHARVLWQLETGG